MTTLLLPETEREKQPPPPPTIQSRPAPAPAVTPAGAATMASPPPPPLPWLAPGQLLVSETAQPPERFLKQLLRGNPRFNQSWNRRRPDFQEQTSRAYQISLAALALGAGWQEQQIVDLLIAWRRRHRREFKPRSAYYRSILEAGRQPARRQRAEADLEHLLTTPAAAASLEQAAALREVLSRLLNCQVNRVIVYDGSPPAYALATERGTARLGPPENWQNQADFQGLLEARIGLRSPACLDHYWPQRRQAILSAALPARGPEPQRLPDQTIQWLAGYLNEFPPRESEWQEQAAAELPFLKNGCKHLFSRPFRDWLSDRGGPRLSPHDMGQRLRKLGATPITLAFPKEPNPAAGPERPASRQCWRLPADH